MVQDNNCQRLCCSTRDRAPRALREGVGCVVREKNSSKVAASRSRQKAFWNTWNTFWKGFSREGLKRGMAEVEEHGTDRLQGPTLYFETRH